MHDRQRERKLPYHMDEKKRRHGLSFGDECFETTPRMAFAPLQIPILSRERICNTLMNS